MLVDTDILIWNLRGHEGAADLLDGAGGFHISAVTYMELVQGMRDKAEFRLLRRSLHQWDAHLVHISEEVSSRATFLVEEYALSHNMQLAGALIAATALHLGDRLVTANDRHYRHIEGLEIQLFRA